MCHHAYKDIRGKNLTAAGFQTILDKLPDLTLVSPQGLGEPLLNPDLFSMLEMARRRSIRTYVNTNLTLLSEQKARQIVLLSDQLIVSMSGATKYAYEEIHRGASFENVVENIRRLVQAGNSMQRGTVDIGIKFVILNRNVEGAQQLIALAEDLGVRTVWLDDLIPFRKVDGLQAERQTQVREMGAAKKMARGKKIRLIVDSRERASNIS